MKKIAYLLFLAGLLLVNTAFADTNKILLVRDKGSSALDYICNPSGQEVKAWNLLIKNEIKNFTCYADMDDDAPYDNYTAFQAEYNAGNFDVMVIFSSVNSGSNAYKWRNLTYPIVVLGDSAFSGMSTCQGDNVQAGGKYINVTNNTFYVGDHYNFTGLSHYSLPGTTTTSIGCNNPGIDIINIGWAYTASNQGIVFGVYENSSLMYNNFSAPARRGISGARTETADTWAYETNLTVVKMVKWLSEARATETPETPEKPYYWVEITNPANITNNESIYLSYTPLGNYTYTEFYRAGSLQYNGSNTYYNFTGLLNNTAYTLTIKAFYNATVFNSTDLIVTTEQNTWTPETPEKPYYWVEITNPTNITNNESIYLSYTPLGNYTYTEFYRAGSLQYNGSNTYYNFTGLLNNTLYNLTIISFYNVSIYNASSVYITTLNNVEGVPTPTPTNSTTTTESDYCTDIKTALSKFVYSLSLIISIIVAGVVITILYGITTQNIGLEYIKEFIVVCLMIIIFAITIIVGLGLFSASCI